jgi:hypothetical protein
MRIFGVSNGEATASPTTPMKPAAYVAGTTFKEVW